MKPAGVLLEIEENKIDAASAISGCGPAFAYMFVEALSDGGVECGLPRDVAQRLAAQTILGAAVHCLYPEQINTAARISDQNSRSRY